MRTARQARAGRTAAAAAPAPAKPAPARPLIPRSQRPQRGTNAKLIEEVLQAIAPRSARPTEIRDALKREKGVDMAFTSIRHALGQLEARHAVEQVANSKNWRFVAGGAEAMSGVA
jgi:hypothetical protein